MNVRLLHWSWDLWPRRLETDPRPPTWRPGPFLTIPPGGGGVQPPDAKMAVGGGKTAGCPMASYWARPPSGGGVGSAGKKALIRRSHIILGGWQISLVWGLGPNWEGCKHASELSTGGGSGEMGAPPDAAMMAAGAPPGPALPVRDPRDRAEAKGTGRQQKGLARCFHGFTNGVGLPTSEPPPPSRGGSRVRR